MQISDALSQELERKYMEHLHVVTTFLSTLLSSLMNTVETNKMLSNINYIIKHCNSQLEISTCKDFMAKDIFEELDANGCHPVLIPTANGTILLTDNSQHTKEVKDRINMKTAQMVALGMDEFSQRNTTRNCFVYNGFNKDQLDAFRKYAEQHSFQFGFTEHDGKYDIAVTSDVASRYHTNQIAHNCAIFNKCGILNAREDLKAERRRMIRDNAINNIKNSEARYYIDIKCPSRYIEVADGSITVHDGNDSRVYSANRVEVADVLNQVFSDSDRNDGDIIEVSKEDFLHKYKETALDGDARVQFCNDETVLTAYNENAILFGQIVNTVEKNKSIDPMMAISKVLLERARKMSDGPQKEDAIKFFENYQKGTRQERVDIMKYQTIPAIMTPTEKDMLDKATKGTLSAEEFTYGYVMAKAEMYAQNHGQPEVVKILSDNQFNIQNIQTLLKTQDVIESGMVVASNPELAANVTQAFEYGLQNVVSAELNNNARFLAVAEQAYKEMQALNIVNHMMRQVQLKGDTEMETYLKQTEPSQIVPVILNMQTGLSPRESGFPSFDKKGMETAFQNYFDNAEYEVVQGNYTHVSLMKNVLEEYYNGTSMFGIAVNEQTMEEMMQADKQIDIAKAVGSNLHGHDDEFNLDDIEIIPNEQEVGEQSKNEPIMDDPIK